jgi:hypothetical protein
VAYGIPVKTIAVLAVHGVGDQQPFETARRIGDLLQNLDRGAPPTAVGPTYRPFEERTIRFSIRPVVVPADGAPADNRPSMRGPFHAWVTRRWKAADPAHPESADTAAREFMRGQLRGYRGENPEDTYESIRLEGARGASEGSDARVVHVYELYWADLSRLKAGLLSIFTELYQLLFHLSSLGTHVVDAEALGHRTPAWDRFRRAQSTAAMILAVPIPILNLIMLGVAAIAIGLVELDRLTPAWQFVLAAAVVALAASAAIGRSLWLREAGPLAWIAPVFLWIAIVCGAAYYGHVSCASGGIAHLRACQAIAAGSRMVENITLVAIAAGLLAMILLAYDRRRPGAAKGALAAAGVMLPLGWIGAALSKPPAEVDPLVFVWARTFEALFGALAVAWALFFLLAIASFALGSMAVRAVKDADARVLAARGRWTARLMLSLPTFAFIVVTLVGWSLVAMALKPRLGAIAYVPILRVLIHASTLGELADALLQNPATVALPLVLVAGGVAALPAIWGAAPVLWTELRAPTPREARDRAYTARLGRWLTHAFAGLTLSGVIMYAAMTFALPLGALIALLQTLGYLQQNLWGAALPHIQTLGMATGAAFAWLFAIRGRLKKLALGFRPGLDILLDVDNWMRELPADANPRARICGRYASLLRSIAAGGYDALVIVAHSQGTVITADLLRFLRNDASPNDDPQIARLAAIPVYLFTMGCPLRDLYAARFPRLYHWARRPEPAALGVRQWTNAYRSGDYIGRSLWPDERTDDLTRTDVCIGAGAHTHYWDRTAPMIAEMLDRAIARA